MATAERVQLLPEDVRTSFQKLALAASDLNNASDELSHAVSLVEDKLEALNFGIPVWTEVSREEDEMENYVFLLLGYAKVGNRWGVAIERQTGNGSSDDSFRSETWLFDDAPRQLRIDATDGFAALIGAMAKTAEEVVSRIRSKAGAVEKLASALTSPSPKPQAAPLRKGK